MRVVHEQHFVIAGSGSYLPKRMVSAEELDERCHLPRGWCRKQVGVETRHECVAPESMISMGVDAMKNAIADACLGWNDIDLIIDCSTSQYRPIPCNAAHYQQELGEAARGIPCFDIHSSCLGSLVAMNMLNSMLGMGTCQHVMLVASESGLGGVNYQEPESACLIGDGAAALVLSRKPSYATLGFSLQTFAEHIDLCHVEGGGHKLPVFEYQPAHESLYRFTMDGPAVFRVALKRLRPMVKKLTELWQQTSGVSSQQLHFIPHQASPRALATVQRMFAVDETRFHNASRSVGNMVAASLPFMIDRVRRSGAVPSGTDALALGTSAGYSQAAFIFRM